MAYSSHDFDSNSVNSENLSLSLKRENASSYGGINSTLNEEQSITDCSHNNKSKNKLKNTNTKDVTFQWDEEESEFYLTGSFCNWKQFFIMPKIDNKYSVTLALPKALHKFKFRINEDFRLNNKYPVMKEGDLNCNYIDTSDSKDTTRHSINSKKSINSNKTQESEESESDSDSDNSSSYEREIDDEESKFRRKKLKMKKKKIFTNFSEKI